MESIWKVPFLFPLLCLINDGSVLHVWFGCMGTRILGVEQVAVTLDLATFGCTWFTYGSSMQFFHVKLGLIGEDHTVISCTE